MAISRLRQANYLHNLVQAGIREEDELLPYEGELLHHLEHGTLEVERDTAVEAYNQAAAGHADVVREVTDTWKHATAAAF